jgi:hypothetical protein
VVKHIKVRISTDLFKEGPISEMSEIKDKNKICSTVTYTFVHNFLLRLKYLKGHKKSYEVSRQVLKK